MKNCLFSLIVAFILSFGLSEISAQENISSRSGDDATMSNPSTGQVAYAEKTELPGSALEDKKATMEFSVVSSLEEAEEINLTQTKGSNATDGLFTLSLNADEQKDITDYSYQVYDLKGKLWESKTIHNKKINISMKEFSPANYLIMIFENNQAVKIFKVVKR